MFTYFSFFADTLYNKQALFLSKDGTFFGRKIKLSPKLLLTIFHFVLFYNFMNLDNKQNEISVYVISFCLLSKFIKL